MSSELRTNSGFVFLDERTQARLRAETKAAMATLEAQRSIMQQALPLLAPAGRLCACGEPMELYGLHWRCYACGALEEV